MREKAIQLTRACQRYWSSGSYDLVEVDDFFEINSLIKDYDWIVVQSAGDLISDREYLQEKLESVDNDVGLIAHLLWYDNVDNCPYIHEQCFIINTKAIKNTIKFVDETDHGRSFVRSEEDMHNGHAPLYVTYGIDTIRRDKKFGTNLIIEVLNNGYKARNFDMSWRFNPASDFGKGYDWFLDKFNFPSVPTRGYIYPELESDHYEIAFKNLQESQFLDPLQNSVIRLYRELLSFDCLNVIHWDKLAESGNFATVISPANGLLGESLGLTANANKIIFYDINKNNIEFKKYMYEEWDGKNYLKFAEDYAAAHNLKLEPSSVNGIGESIRSHQHIDEVYEQWTKLKSLNKEFIHIDIVKNYNTLLDKISENTLIHTSTIFTYYLQSNIMNDQKTIDDVRNKIMNKIKDTNSLWKETK